MASNTSTPASNLGLKSVNLGMQTVSCPFHAPLSVNSKILTSMKKVKPALIKLKNIPKPKTDKQVEVSEVIPPPVEVKSPKSQAVDRIVATPKQLEQAKYLQQLKMETVERVAGDAKRVEKPETMRRATRNKTLSTNAFLDKYMKFAYDLSTPQGVQKLEQHFFPNESTKVLPKSELSGKTPNKKTKQ